MGSPVIHFEIHADDRPALAGFYEEVFGWKTMSAGGMPYTLIWPTGEDLEPGQPPTQGIGGGMMDRRGPSATPGAPVNGFVCVIHVDDLDSTHEEVTKRGCAIAVEPMDVPGVGRVFYFHDPSNNIVGVLESA